MIDCIVREAMVDRERRQEGEGEQCTVLEFFCGIGGLRYAYEMATKMSSLPSSHPLCKPAKIVSFDISS